MKTERFAPGNVVPTAVMPMETAVFAGIWVRAPTCDGVAMVLDRDCGPA
jgi:hypothetical protein